MSGGSACSSTAAWWGRILRGDPSYERYARATSLTIPVLRLVPLPAAG